MKTSSPKKPKINSTGNNQSEVDSKKVKIEEVLFPSTNCSTFLIFCKKTAKKKLRGFNKSSW